MSDQNSRASAKGAPVKVQCPTCRMTIPFHPANKFRPFCSARCREADLAAWASDRYQIPGSQRNTEQQSDEDPTLP